MGRFETMHNDYLDPDRHLWPDEGPDDGGRGYTLDEYGHAVLPDGTSTDPYGHLNYGIGNADDFHCLDYLLLPDGTVALHSVVNIETASFIQDAGYGIVPRGDALRLAADMIGDAITWCCDGGDPLEPDLDGWNHGGRRFLIDLARDLEQPLPDELVDWLDHI